MLTPEGDALQFLYVHKCVHTRNDLPDDGRPSRTRNAPFETENEYGVKYGVDDCAYHHCGHRIGRAAVSAGEIAHAVHNDDKRHADGGYPCVLHRVGENFIYCAERYEHLL